MPDDIGDEDEYSTRMDYDDYLQSKINEFSSFDIDEWLRLSNNSSFLPVVNPDENSVDRKTDKSHREYESNTETYKIKNGMVSFPRRTTIPPTTSSHLPPYREYINYLYPDYINAFNTKLHDDMDGGISETTVPAVSSPVPLSARTVTNAVDNSTRWDHLPDSTPIEGSDIKSNHSITLSPAFTVDSSNGTVFVMLVRYFAFLLEYMCRYFI